MVKNKKYSSNTYTYGNVAYDYEPEIKKKVKSPKVPRTKKKANSKLKLIKMIVIVFVMAFMVTVRFTAIMNINSDIRQLKTDIKTVQQDNENIKVEIAKLNNIRNLEKLAVEKEGMRVPSANEVFYVDVKPLTLSTDTKKTETTLSLIKQLFGALYRGVNI